MKENFKSDLEKILKKDKRLVDENGELNANLIHEYASSLNEGLIDLLLNEVATREKFFLKVKDVYVFKQNDFKFFLDENKIDNSYTQYPNRIGLNSGGKFLNDFDDVVLDFPYKDCVLEGGQSTEEGTDTYFEYDEDKQDYIEKATKRKEIFFNQVLAKDEIDRLTEPKAFTNIKRYTEKGEEQITCFNRDGKGKITDNLIIKGNNLLALHSLKEQFQGKIKLIYIDPPYNTGGDSFAYNDNFNHSSWLTFTRNRMIEAKELLADNGVILVQCDHHELGYLNLILDEVFGKENKIQHIAVKVASPSGFKAVNPGPIDVMEDIFFYAKNKKNIKFKRNFVETGYHKNYNKYLEKNSDDSNEWKLLPLKAKVLEFNRFKDETSFKKQYGDYYKGVLETLTEEFAFNNPESVVSIRDLHKPTKQVNELQEKSKKERNKFFVYDKQDGEKMYLINGGALAFYSSKLNKVNGEIKVTELLSNFWDHISWAGIAKEGGVKLKNGKKPEKLLKQIFELNVNKGDIVLDYHLGSGTTAAVAHKMGIQYIGIEQLDYSDNDSTQRLINGVNGDKPGVSKFKDVNWDGGGSFVFCELAKNNQKAIDRIMACKSLKELIALFDELYEKYFLNYNVKISEFKEKIVNEKAFQKLPHDKHKEIFARMLDLNQLYINVSDMEDSQFKLSKEDITLTKDFYQL